MADVRRMTELGVPSEVAKELNRLDVGTKTADIATIGTADATDLATAITLANATKARVNELITALKA